MEELILISLELLRKDITFLITKKIQVIDIGQKKAFNFMARNKNLKMMFMILQNSLLDFYEELIQILKKEINIK